MSGAKEQFVADLYPAATKVAKDTGMSRELILSQAALETGWGEKVLPGTNNYFNIKATPDWTGPTKTFKVPEYDATSGKTVMEDAQFRVYGSKEEALTDRVKFLQENPRYGKSGIFDAGVKGDLIKEATALQKAGYATDPDYASKLAAVYNGPTMQRGIQIVEPDLTNKYNAGHPLYEQALTGLQKYNHDHDITVDAAQTRNAAASLALSARRSGLTKIDEVTVGGNDGSTIFALQGKPGSALSRTADVPTVASLNTPTEKSSQAFAAVVQAEQIRAPAPPLQQQTQQPLQQPALSR